MAVLKNRLKIFLPKKMYQTNLVSRKWCQTLFKSDSIDKCTNEDSRWPLDAILDFSKYIKNALVFM